VIVTGALQREAWQRGGLPPVELVRPGLWSIPVPIPQGVLRYVLVYALELDSGIALIDAGWDTDEAWAALQGGLAIAGGSIADVSAVIVTHVHRDHSGLAGRIREQSGAWVGLHPADAALLTTRYQTSESFQQSMRETLAMAGAPENAIPELNTPAMDVRSFAALTPPDRLIDDGDAIGLSGWDLTAIWTPGHSPGHICLYSPSQRLMFSGDHVLPRISPNISFHSSTSPNPLEDFLCSLVKVEDLTCDEVLPGHEWRFTGLKERVKELRSHHDARLGEIRSVLTEDELLTCWEIATQLTWSRELDVASPFILRTSSGETLAHVAYLESVGDVLRTDEHPARFHLARHH
jgi:glyoxylase-like metal-dependent hydrolase (beta-lactamase superfamily II)